MAWVEAAPLALVGLLFMATLAVGVEVGYRGQLWLSARNQGKGAPPDHILSAVLGLLALLLGFTFSLSLNRFEGRRDLVVREANAIGTVWLRANLLEEPERQELRELLRRYVDIRLAWSDTDGADNDIAATSALQGQLWAVTGRAVRSDSSPLLARGLMDAMNDAFDLAGSRAAARAAHIPGRVLGVLLLYAALSMIMLGYMLAAGGRPHRLATTLLAALLSLAVVVILDLDRPRDGAIQVSQQPLLDLKSEMR
ncbi:uncharacterized protein DUF4239 [Nitrospirillum pindoramense]|uniref:Uncharacterized protein DUF4239 n=2 Tax=Nitrospirillum amazonense TaxID=28077 RepID=A0A560H4D8_9PROT|nr:uncharacterized protein DUF4239 [Nitrospirillum amazonense]